MYLLYTQAGGSAQDVLREYIERDAIVVHDGSQAEAKRACALMKRYLDVPIDFADASLVVAAETLKMTRILTLDRHFYAYRIYENILFEVIPG